MADTVLNIREKIVVDESIKEYEFYEYQPITGTQLNTAGQITITIENTDDFYHPNRSWLLFEGDLLKTAADARYAQGDLIALTNKKPKILELLVKNTLEFQTSGSTKAQKIQRFFNFNFLSFII